MVRKEKSSARDRLPSQTLSFTISKKSGKDKEFSEEQSESDFEDYFSQDDVDWNYAIEYFPKIKDYFKYKVKLKSISKFCPIRFHFFKRLILQFFAPHISL